MFSGFLCVLILSAVHLFANRSKVLGWIWRGRFLSFAGGVSFAYVFIDLLPSLGKGQPVLKRTFGELIPYFDRHAYLIALLGMLFYYGIEKGKEGKGVAWLSLSGYLLFNLFVGASLADSTNPEIQPLTLFTIAMAMHYFVRDHNLGARAIQGALVAALLIGYGLGVWTHIPDAVVAVTISFLAGGIILNVLHYELPKREGGGFPFFLLGALLYSAILLSVGEVPSSF